MPLFLEVGHQFTGDFQDQAPFSGSWTALWSSRPYPRDLFGTCIYCNTRIERLYLPNQQILNKTT